MPPKKRKKAERKHRRGIKYKNDSFPMKLHRLLVHLEENKQAHIAAFSDDGTRFHIFDKIALERDCLTQFFRHGNFKSFKRLLYMYGFERTSLNGAQETYRHEDFTRDNPSKCKDMCRKNSTAEQMRQASAQKEEEEHEGKEGEPAQSGGEEDSEKSE